MQLSRRPDVAFIASPTKQRPASVTTTPVTTPQRLGRKPVPQRAPSVQSLQTDWSKYHLSLDADERRTSLQNELSQIKNLILERRRAMGSAGNESLDNFFASTGPPAIVKNDSMTPAAPQLPTLIGGREAVGTSNRDKNLTNHNNIDEDEDGYETIDSLVVFEDDEEDDKV